jgi:thiol-disulfide isomerase/thioredoxin
MLLEVVSAMIQPALPSFRPLRGLVAGAFALALYTAMGLGANHARAADPATLAALRTGDMRALVVHEAARPVPSAVLLDAEDGEHALEDWRGQWVLLNFWATWCAPCRHEMPGLDRIAAELGGPDFVVLPVATGRNPLPAIRRFFEETELQNLPILRDPQQHFAREMAVFGLPVTVLIDPEGREVARLTGDAAWDGPDARALLAAALGR